MKKLINISILFFLVSNCFGQIKAADVKEFKNNPLIIYLPDNDTLVAFMKEAFSTYWYLNTDTVFSTAVPDESKNSILLDTDIYEIRASTGIDPSNPHPSDPTLKQWSTIASMEAFKLKIRVNGKFWGTGFNYYNTGPDGPNHLYYFTECLLRLQFILNEIETEGSWGKVCGATGGKKYTKEVPKRTVLIDKTLLKKNVTQQDIERFYPHSFEIVDAEKVIEAVLSKDPTKAYIAIIEEKPGLLVQYVVLCGSGTMCNHNHSTFQTAGTMTSRSSNDELTLADLKKLLKPFK